jgi:hypothetical protein
MEPLPLIKNNLLKPGISYAIENSSFLILSFYGQGGLLNIVAEFG